METALAVPADGQTDLKTLDDGERADLLACEETIDRGLQSFVDVGLALVKIRDERLYRQGYCDFEHYCRQRWGISRIHAHRQIDAAKVHELLPTGNKPANEAQARPLVRLRLEDGELDRKAITRVWQNVVEQASQDKTGRKVITAELVEEVARPTLQRRGIRVRQNRRSYRRLPPAATDAQQEASVQIAAVPEGSISGETFNRLRGQVEELSSLLLREDLPEKVRSAIENVCDIVLGESL